MKLIKHLPPRLAEIKEIADIQEAVEPEIRGIEESIGRELTNRNPLKADRRGIEQWEEWLKITPGAEKTTEQRQIDIIAKLNERLPLTMSQLYRILTGVLGEGMVDITRVPGEAVIEIGVNVSERDAAGSVDPLLKRIIPAHVLYRISYYYKSSDFTVRAGSACEESIIIETPLTYGTSSIYLSAPYMETEIVEIKEG